MSKPLFSVILLHYNQPKYVKTALDSTLSQNYENIEFIFADDYSTDIDLQNLKNYVNKNKPSNIKNVIWQINETNLGTVKSLNRAVKRCSGEYILFFAADDQLFNENVLSNFINKFKSCNDDIYMISAQCHMMDTTLTKTKELFVNPSFANTFNNYNAHEQYKLLAKICFLAIGATCIKAKMFKRFGYFDETYKLVEDWSYFLHLTRNGGRIIYFDFDALYHRDGGSSHYDDNKLVPSNVLDYKFDMIQIYENEIFPNINILSTREKSYILDKYEQEKASYVRCGGTKSGLSSFKIFKLMPVFFIKRQLWHILSLSNAKMSHYFDRMVRVSVIWIVLILFDLYLFNLSDNLFFLKNLHHLLSKLNLYLFPVLEIAFLFPFTLYFFVFLLYKIRKLLKK